MPFAVLAFVPMLVVPAVIGSALTLVLVNLFPARRTRDLLSLVAIFAAGGVILLFRIIRPERLASPEGFRNLLDFITVLRTPTSPFLPSEWTTNAIMSFLLGRPDPLPLVLLWTTAAAFVTLGAWLHRELFATGFTKAQEGAERFVRGGMWSWTVGTLLKSLPVAKREFVLKDIKLFFRDASQWSQLILLAVLVVVYLFNIKALPLHRGEEVGFFYVDAGVVLEPRPGGVRAGVDRRAVHFPGRVARGPAHVAAALEPARSARAACGPSTGSARCRCSCSRCCSPA